MVELKGVEPLTSSVQTRRSGQLSYSPKIFCLCFLPAADLKYFSFILAFIFESCVSE